MYSLALRPSEINLGFRVQGVGFSRSRIDLERAWGSGLGVLQEQDLDQPLEVDPARSAAVIEHLSAKRFLCARVVIGEQAPGEVRVARREERKVRARQLALTNSCPRDVPSGIIPLGLFPMHSHFGCSDISNVACLLSHSPRIDSPPVPRPAAADAAVVSLCSILADDQDMFSFQSVSCAALHQAPAGVARGVSAAIPGTRHRAISRRLLAQAPGIQTGIHAGLIGQDGKIGIR